MLIGVVVCGIVEDYAINLVKSIEQMSEKNDVKCVIIPIKFLGLDYEKVLNNKYAYCYNSSAAYGLLSCFDGLIIEMASTLMYAEDNIKQQFAALYDNIPHVFISFDKDNVSSVAIDNQAGLRDALEYMHKNGATKYAMFGGPANNIDSVVRKACFEDFISKNNLPYSETSYQEGSFFRPCDREAEQLVSDNMDADVFVCANDFLAKHIYKALGEVGKKPGKDVSVLGFDDSQVCTSTYPTIASIRTDIIEVGKVSFELLLERIKNNTVKRVTVPSKFILRDSICHKEKAKDEHSNNSVFDDYVSIDVRAVTNSQIELIRTKFVELAMLVENKGKVSANELLNNINNKLDELFACEGLECLDWERLSERINAKYTEWLRALSESDMQQRLTDIYIKINKFLMTANNHTSPDKIYADIMKNAGMERFLREIMQFTRNADANYTRYVGNIGFLGINNAFLYMYNEPIYYVQGEKLIIPEYLNLKAVLSDGEAVAVAQNKQRIAREAILDNEYVSWKGYSSLVLFPIFSDNMLYGILLCDIKRKGYEQADLFMNQMGSGIRMMNLRIENRQIVDEYEESVRKLKEYNITLDNMSKTDSLTGLNNRRGFYMRANSLLGMFPNDSMSVVVGYADMNDLKLVNDRFGHDDGDFALRAIGSVITDFVTMYNGFGARIGGDEFAYIFIVPKGSDINKYKKELYDMFDDFNNKSIKAYNVEISAGSYLIEEGMTISLDDALHQADEVLYFEKSVHKKNSILKG